MPFASCVALPTVRLSNVLKSEPNGPAIKSPVSRPLVSDPATKISPKIGKPPPVEKPKTVRARPQPKATEVANDQNSTASVDNIKRLQAEAEASIQQLKQSPAADPMSSLTAMNNIKEMIAETDSLGILEGSVASTINTEKAKLTPGHLQDVLASYAARKEILSQQDIFDDLPEVSYVDAVIARIQNAKSQDDINAVYADPAFDELSGADRERIDNEAQQREAELQD